MKNFLTLSSGETVARAMHIIAIILLGRTLGPEKFGLFELALAITSYVILGVRQGFDVLGTEAVAGDRSREGGWLSAIVRLRLALCLTAAAGSFIWASIAGWDHPLSTLLMLFTGSYLASAITPRWRFLALEMPRPPAIGAVVSQFIFLGSVIFFVHSPQDASNAVIGWVMGEFGEAAILWSVCRPTQGLQLQSPVKAKWLLRESLPLTASLLLGQIMYNFDVLALAFWGRSAEIGLYLASYRCATVFAPLLGNLQASIFPQFVRNREDPQLVLKSALRLATWAGLAGIAIAVIFTFQARNIIGLVFGAAYSPAVPFLQILIWILPFQFPRAVLRQVVLASGLKLSDSRNVALSATTNIAIDLALVSSWGALGCSISTLCSEFVLLMASWWTVRSHVAARTQ